MAAQPPGPADWAPPADLNAGPAPGVLFASPAKRLLAYIVDWLVVGAVSVATFIVLGVVIGAAGSAGADFLAGIGIILAVVVWFALALAYFPWFWARGGQTPGMKVFRIRVVRDADGGPVSAGSAIIRLIGYWINGIVFYIGYIWILVDKRRRGWHDLLAGTCVVDA